MFPCSAQLCAIAVSHCWYVVLLLMFPWRSLSVLLVGVQMVGVQCTREATAAPGQFLPHSLWSLPNLRPVAKETPSLSCLSSSHVQQVRPKLLLEPLLYQVNLPFLISISLNRNQNVEYMLRQSPDIQQMWDSMQNMWFGIFFPPSHSFELPRSFLL